MALTVQKLREYAEELQKEAATFTFHGLSWAVYQDAADAVANAADHMEHEESR